MSSRFAPTISLIRNDNGAVLYSGTGVASMMHHALLDAAGHATIVLSGLLADTLRTAGNTPLQIPVKVTGSMTDPTIRPDIEALAKGQLKQKVQDLLQDKKVQDKVKDKLRIYFTR